LAPILWGGGGFERIDMTERKQAEQTLEDRLRFERLLSDLSARFVNLNPA
jgi:hypothetical protein